MRKTTLLSFLTLAIVAVPALAGGPPPAWLYPGAYENGPNFMGNMTYCYDGAASTFCLNNVDLSGQGFNDPAALAGVGGNTGTTVGQNRINTYMAAFNIWGDILPSSSAIWVQGTFGPLACDADSGVLGAAGTIQIFADDGIYGGGFYWPLTWYHAALIQSIIGFDIIDASPDPGLLEPPFADEIVSFFNGDLGSEDCLEESGWYYGFDNNEGADEIDFMTVLLHEMAHGLGHANFIDENGDPNGCTNPGNCDDNPGSGALGRPDIYTVFSRENSMGGKHWNQMSDGERVVSATSGSLVWDGPNTQYAAGLYLGGPPVVRMNTPYLEYYAANSSGTPLEENNDVTGDVVYATPANLCGEGTTDAALSGKIALIDRGSCAFQEKYDNAIASGAIAGIVANAVPGGGTIGMLGTYTMPYVMISYEDGLDLKSNLPANVTLRTDTALGLAGADENGFPFLYTPSTFSSGSSVSHWDTSLNPNAMMEPFINDDLETATTLDISPAQMADVGWFGSVFCPVGTDDSSTIVIDGCDSGVSNYPGPWTIQPTPRGKGAKRVSGQVAAGCYLADIFHGCVGNVSHGDFVTCSTNAANELRKQGVLSYGDVDAIMACVESADLP